MADADGHAEALGPDGGAAAAEVEAEGPPGAAACPTAVLEQLGLEERAGWRIFHAGSGAFIGTLKWMVASNSLSCVCKKHDPGEGCKMMLRDPMGRAHTNDELVIAAYKWLADGQSCMHAQHLRSAFDVKKSFGMRPRPL